MKNCNPKRIFILAIISACTLGLMTVYYNGFPQVLRLESINQQPMEFSTNINDQDDVQNEVKLKEEALCEVFETDEFTCAKIHSVSAPRRKIYPIQLVSGSPGSGNDWILWLGAVLGYERDMEWLLKNCEVYHNQTWNLAKIGLQTNCIYIKTHEPFFYHKNALPWATRAAVVLRHPIDAAYAEFKRQEVAGFHNDNENYLKSNTTGIKLSHFFNNDLTAVTEKWKLHLKMSTFHWLEHAKFWLTEWDKPLRVVIYTEFKTNTINELTLLLQYFGFSFTKDYMHRFCCIKKDPFNPDLKRGFSEIDTYKGMLFKLTPNLLETADNAVKEVQSMLDSQWPGIHNLTRG